MWAVIGGVIVLVLYPQIQKLPLVSKIPSV